MKLIPCLMAGLVSIPLVPAIASPGDVDTSFNSNAAINGAVLTTIAQTNGQVLVGGAFTFISGVLRGGIARLNSDGTLDSGFLNGLSGANSYVWSAALQPDGKVLLAGFFTAVNGVSRNGVARLNADGSLDNSFLNTQAGANGAVYCVARQPDNKILIAGDFTSINGVRRNYFARLNSDGSVDSSFLNGMDGADTAVFCLALQSDGKILIGGWFTAVNGIGRLHLARLNSDGSVDTSFLNGLAGPLGRVWSIALQTNGQILIGGDFTSVNGIFRDRLARLNSDGALDTSFLNGVGVSDDVWSIAVETDGKIIIGGEFTSLLGIDRNSLARLNTNGTMDSSFLGGEPGPNNVVRSLSIQNDGKLLLGGQFTEINNVTRNYVARLLTAVGPPSMSNPRRINNQFSFDFSGEAGRTVVVQGSTDFQQWVSLATNVLTSTPSTFTDSQSQTLGQRYYRLVTQ